MAVESPRDRKSNVNCPAFIHHLVHSLNPYLDRALVSENKLHQLRTADICIFLFLHLHSNQLLP